MWGSKPRTMIKKVAIAQGFRLAFPVELGGIPYTADELPGNNVAPEVVAPEPPPVQKLESIKQPLIDTISRETAGSISNDLKRANIHPADLFESFGITRLGELKLTQIEDVFAWIAGKAIIPEPVIDAQMDNDAGWPDPPELKKAA